jgi:hypothetical protein
MGRETEGHRGRHGGRVVGTLLLLFTLPALPSCLDFRPPDGAPFPLPFGPRSGVQEGEVTVKEGEQAKVRYKHPFESPPHLTIVEFRESQFRDKPYAKSDFQIIREEAGWFAVRNNHAEQGGGSWATVKWRAEGTPARGQPGEAGAQPGTTPQEAAVERAKHLGGSVTYDPARPKGPVIGVDLHRTRVTDTDLELLQALTGVRTLNLYGTRVTDAGLKHVGGLNSLQTLYLNDTPVTDAGLPHLQGLTGLKELGLDRTRVTDEGLPQLKKLAALNKLVLGGPQITDRGLRYLKDFRSLKSLLLDGAGVTPDGIRELKRALPNLEILQ